MLVKAAEKYYFEKDCNCAESVLLAANEVYALGLAADCHRLLSAFGGGMGCGSTCGALAGAMAVLGQAAVRDRAHVTEGFKALCAGFVAKFERALSSQDCAKIKPLAFDAAGNRRCFRPVEIACRLLEEELAALRA